MGEEIVKASVISDTSPLITLCTFKVAGKLVIDYLLSAVQFMVVDTVASEATANPTHSDSAVIQSLLQTGQIQRLAVPSSSPGNPIDNYTKLGQGERDSIRLALTTPATQILSDDHLAFVVAARFGLQPILLLDFVVSLAQNENLSSKVAFEIVENIAPRYSTPFVDHTRYKLNEIAT